MRTWPKSWLNRASEKARVLASRGWPGERNASYTVGDASGGAGVAAVWNEFSRCLWHTSHSPVRPGVVPQAHFRWSGRLLSTDLNNGGAGPAFLARMG